LVINGGVVNAKLSVNMGNLTINGGQISTPDSGIGIILTRGTLTLGCSNYSDFIHANQYMMLSATAVVKEGQTLTDGTNLYTGTLTTAEIDTLANKTLRLGIYREIAGYGDSDGGYYLIATPFESVDPATVAGMTDGEFDLYAFDQAEEMEWRNYKVGDGFNLVSGKGYLYAHDTDITLIFTGTPYSGSGEVTLSKVAGTIFEGWNLVGNPFTETAYIDRPFYVMNSDGSEIIAAAEAEQDSIAPMEGVFVIANKDEEIMTFTTEAPGNGGKGLALNLSQGHGVIDRAIVRFGEGRQLPKFMLNESNTKVYIPQNNRDYAVVSADNQGEMPVSFKAKENGTYTLSFSSEEVGFNYLHLIDNLTGADIDLLQNPSYSFEARTTDYASRFKLVFATGEAESDNFAFISNGQLIVNGEGTLQVIDMLGHVLYTHEVHSDFQLLSSDFSSGVYVLRLVNGDNMKTQKMVIE
jgi:hypothetical protein